MLKFFKSGKNKNHLKIKKNRRVDVGTCKKIFKNIARKSVKLFNQNKH